MNIGVKDVVWNYLATFLKIGSSIILLPLILKYLSSEDVGVWTVFMSFSALISMLDFGFKPSFTRNVTYVFSGAKKLLKNGIETDATNSEIDYGLLKSLIEAMRWFYFRMALILVVFLAVGGTIYIQEILKDYKGDVLQIYIAWGLFCLISSYNMYTYYYESLLEGTGKIMVVKKITILGNIVYLFSAFIMVINGFGLVAIVSASLLSVVINRVLFYRSFYTKDIRLELSKSSQSISAKTILKIISPNSLKVGLTSLGGYMSRNFLLIIAGIYISLEQLAEYGVTVQVVSVISSMSAVYINTFLVKVSYYWINNDTYSIKKLYQKGLFISLLFYFGSSFILLQFGNKILLFLNSKTLLLENSYLLILLLLSFFEIIIIISGNILLSKNSVPFFKSSLLSGLAIVLLTFLFVEYFEFQLWSFIVAPIIVQVSYNLWKWPIEVYKSLQS